MKSLIETESLFFCSSYNAPTLFRNLQKRSFSVAMSKRLTHYGPRSGLQSKHPIHPTATRGRAEKLCGLEPWELYGEDCWQDNIINQIAVLLYQRNWSNISTGISFMSNKNKINT